MLTGVTRLATPVDSESKPSVEELEVSIVIPCLNEHETVGVCVQKAMRVLREEGIAGEVIVADNGSTDGSVEIARAHGARVLPVSSRGYGNTLMGGIEAAQGRYIVMGDADDSYDFLEVPKFVAKLRQGADLVQGCRLPAGGGTVRPGAMPWLHYWIGNPLFTLLAGVMFKSPVHDIYCGMRGFSRRLYEQLNMRCTGMEFATEMIIKSSLLRAGIQEVPITLHPDGRKTRRPHLRTFRDGWRTLRFFLMYSPEWLFFFPGVLLILLGLFGYALAMPQFTLFGATFDAHTLLFASLAIMMGYQSALFAIFAETFAINEGLRPLRSAVRTFFKIFRLERGILLGAAAMGAGGLLLLLAVWQWWQASWGRLEYPRTMRLVVPGVTLTACGFQTVLASFFTSILGLKRK